LSREEIDGWNLENYQAMLNGKSLHLTLKNGKSGNQPHIFDRVVVANANDLLTTNFGCAYDAYMNKINLIINPD